MGTWPVRERVEGVGGRRCGLNAVAVVSCGLTGEGWRRWSLGGGDVRLRCS